MGLHNNSYKFSINVFAVDLDRWSCCTLGDLGVALPGNNAWAAHSRQECSREGATGRMAEWQNGRSEVETLECAENGSGTYGWCLGGKELVNHGWMSHFTLYLLLSLSFQTMQALQDIKRLDSLEPRCQKLVIVESCLLELNQCRAMLARQIDKKIL